MFNFLFPDKNKNKKYADYLSGHHLNMALRYLLKDDNPDTDFVVKEICWAIIKADGTFSDDVKDLLYQHHVDIPLIYKDDNKGDY